MNRREALARVVAMTGTMVIGAEFFLTGCSPRAKERSEPFTPQELALMDEIAETIIPTTDTRREGGGGRRIHGHDGPARI
jgi:hypothetical protein